MELWNLGRNSLTCQYTQRTERLEGSFAEKNLVVQVATKLVSHQQALVKSKVNNILGCTGKSVISRLREMIFSTQVRAHLEHCVQSLEQEKDKLMEHILTWYLQSIRGECYVIINRV